MKSTRWVVFCLVIISINTFSFSQSSSSIVSGPMLTQVELRTAKVWVEVKPGTLVELWYWKKGNIAAARKLSKATDAQSWFSPVIFDLVNLEMNTSYEYQVIADSL